MKPLTIAVTGLNAIDSPGPGIPVIRALRDSKHFDPLRIVGLAYEPLEPGIYMHSLIDKTYTIPFPSLGRDTLLARLAWIHEREGLDVIIPNFDAELPAFIRLRSQLADMGIATLLPTPEQFDMRLKGNLPALGEQFGVAVPASLAVSTLTELREALGVTGYPAMIKGKFYEAAMARSYEEALNHFYKLSAKWGVPVIVQQYVQGIELNVTALGDGRGRLIGAVPSRKTYITDKGKGWAGVVIDDEALIEVTRRLVEGMRWAGGIEIEMMRDTKNDKLYLIEINPRFPAWVYLAVGCGQNHPEALVRLALGEEVEPFADYERGKMFIRYSWDMICALSEFEQISTRGEL